MKATENIPDVLALVGELLTFPQAEILAIPGFQVETLVSMDDNYKVERQSFTFQVASADVIENDIKQDDTFTFDDGNYLYTFKLNRYPMPDLTGWSKLDVDLLTKTVL